jgi:hypothetical protein
MFLKLWLWFNGKKTIIGAVLLMAHAFMQHCVVGIWHYDNPTFLNFDNTVDWLGQGFTGMGITHKLLKELPTKDTTE